MLFVRDQQQSHQIPGPKKCVAWAGVWLREAFAADRYVRCVLYAFVFVGLSGMLWDLPGAHGWENDGIAPRGLFSGLAESLSPGRAHRYPLFHYLLSLLASLPALSLIPVFAGSLSGKALATAASGVGVMTGVSLGIKLLSLSMGSVTLLALAKYTRETFGPLAARFTAVFFALNLSVSYYTRTSNLDVPYMMWTLLLLCLIAELTRTQTPRTLDRPTCLLIALFAALAVATKDQAYASVLPLLLVCLGLVKSTKVLQHLVVFGTLAYVLASGIALNPTGFPNRLKLLTGPNSQDYAAYSADISGRLDNLLDIARGLPEWWWPLPVLLLCALGLLLAALRAVRTRSVAPLLPLFVSLGCLFLFTLVVRRAEHRFVLPCAICAACYAGVGASALWSVSRKNLTLGRMCQVGLGIVLALAASLPIALLCTQLYDGRRRVSAFLETQPTGTRVETYGLPVYLPHFRSASESPYRVSRLEPSGTKLASLLHVERVEGSYLDLATRSPDVLVIPEVFSRRYLSESAMDGRIVSARELRAQEDVDASRFFAAALSDTLPGYKLAFVAGEREPAWMSAVGLNFLHIQGSTGERTFVLTKRSE